MIEQPAIGAHPGDPAPLEPNDRPVHMPAGKAPLQPGMTKKHPNAVANVVRSSKKGGDPATKPPPSLLAAPPNQRRQRQAIRLLVKRQQQVQPRLDRKVLAQIIASRGINSRMDQDIGQHMGQGPQPQGRRRSIRASFPHQMAPHQGGGLLRIVEAAAELAEKIAARPQTLGVQRRIGQHGTKEIEMAPRPDEPTQGHIGKPQKDLAGDVPMRPLLGHGDYRGWGGAAGRTLVKSQAPRTRRSRTKGTP